MVFEFDASNSFKFTGPHELAFSPTVPLRKSFVCNTCGEMHKCWALLTSSMGETMPQAVDVVGQAEQQGLADLGGQAASGCARGELAFDGGEHAFDLVALPIRFFRKSSEHLIANGTVRNTPASRGDNALRSQALPNVLVVGFGVKLRIRQHHPEGSTARRHIQQPRQSTRIAPRPLTGPLRQQNLLPYIHHNQPLQPRTTRPGPVRMLLQAAVEEGADGSIGESSAVDGGSNGPAPASPQPTHGFLQSAIDGVILQPPQKTIQRGVVGHRWQVQRGAQLVVLAQAYFGFAKGPVFVAHQAQHRQQLRLGELMFAEARAVGRQNLRGHLQCHARKRQESDFGHRPSCPIRKHRKPLLVDPLQRKLCPGCQQSPSVANKRLTEELNPLDATLTKNRGWGALPFDVLTPIPANVSNAFPIYPLCFHTLAALTGSTALEQLFSNQPVTHSFHRNGGCTPSRTLPIFSASLSTVPSHESPVTSHGSCLPLSTTVQSATLSLMYIVPGLSSPLFVRGIARCLGGRHEQNFEDCSHRRRRAGRSCSRRAVFDPRQSVPPHH